MSRSLRHYILFFATRSYSPAMNHSPVNWGRPSEETYGKYNHQIANAEHTTSPTITGTSIVAAKFASGIIMAADNMASYGSLMRFEIERLIQVGDETVVGVSGDVSDMQQIERMLAEIVLQDNYSSTHLTAPSVHSYLSLLLYQRRSKMDPLWNSIIVGGFNPDKTPFLKYVDLLGVSYSSSTLATGFGTHLAIPLLRQLIPSDEDYVNVSQDDATKVINDCMRVLFYRDARSMDKFSLVTIQLIDGKVDFSFKKSVPVEKQEWRFAKDIIGYGNKQQ